MTLQCPQLVVAHTRQLLSLCNLSTDTGGAYMYQVLPQPYMYSNCCIGTGDDESFNALVFKRQCC